MEDTEKMQIITDEVCSYLGLTESQIHCKSRKRELVEARQFIFYFSRKYTMLSLKQIGIPWGMNHDNVIYSCNTIDNLRVCNGYKTKYEYLNGVLHHKLPKFDWDKAAVSMAQF